MITNITIPDDGIVNVSRIPATIQNATLYANNLPEGVYRLEFTNFDGLIREIKINTNKIILDKVFLADNELYGVNTTTTKLFTRVNKPSELKFITYHSNGIQNITYPRNFSVNVEDSPVYLNVSKGDYQFVIPKNDLAISYPGYFSFSKENYFEPFRQRVITIPRDLEWIKNNVDYLVTDYNIPEKDNNWLIADTTFNIKDESLYVKDGKLSMVYNVPHLSNDQFINYTIPIDWINITVYKPSKVTEWFGW